METTYIHALKYEVDQPTNQAYFYVEQVPETHNESAAEKKNDVVGQKFLWQSQKWHLTIYNEDELPRRSSKNNSTQQTRRFVRHLKSSDEGQTYDVSEVLIKTKETADSASTKTKETAGAATTTTKSVREFIWTPKDISIEESYILVTFNDTEHHNLPHQIINETELSKSFSASYRASESTHDDFELTYNENDEELFEKSLRQPVGGLARLTYITEKLLHVVETSENGGDEEQLQRYDVKPINMKLHFQPPDIWVCPYQGNYGLDMSHFQISERFGNSIESSLLQITKRTGGYLSDFSLSMSDVRRLKRFRKHDGIEKKNYADLPSDVVVVDMVANKKHQQSDDDEEDFEDLSVDFENLSAPKKTPQGKVPQIQIEVPSTSNTKIHQNVVQPSTTLLSMKDDQKYNELTSSHKSEIYVQPTMNNKYEKKSDGNNTTTYEEISIEEHSYIKEEIIERSYNADADENKVEATAEKQCDDVKSVASDVDINSPSQCDDVEFVASDVDINSPSYIQNKHQHLNEDDERTYSDVCDSGYEENVDASENKPREENKQRQRSVSSDSTSDAYNSFDYSPKPQTFIIEVPSEENLSAEPKKILSKNSQQNELPSSSFEVNSVVCVPYERPEKQTPIETNKKSSKLSIVLIEESAVLPANREMENVDLSLLENLDRPESPDSDISFDYSPKPQTFVMEEPSEETLSTEPKKTLSKNSKENNSPSTSFEVNSVVCTPYERSSEKKIPKETGMNSSTKLSNVIIEESAVLPAKREVEIADLTMLENLDRSESLDADNISFDYSSKPQTFITEVQSEETLSAEPKKTFPKNVKQNQSSSTAFEVNSVVCVPYEKQLPRRTNKEPSSILSNVLIEESEVLPSRREADSIDFSMLEKLKSEETVNISIKNEFEVEVGDDQTQKFSNNEEYEEEIDDSFDNFKISCEAKNEFVMQNPEDEAVLEIEERERVTPSNDEIVKEILPTQITMIPFIKADNVEEAPKESAAAVSSIRITKAPAEEDQIHQDLNSGADFSVEISSPTRSPSKHRSHPPRKEYEYKYEDFIEEDRPQHQGNRLQQPNSPEKFVNETASSPMLRRRTLSGGDELDDHSDDNLEKTSGSSGDPFEDQKTFKKSSTSIKIQVKTKEIQHSDNHSATAPETDNKSEKKKSIKSKAKKFVLKKLGSNNKPSSETQGEEISDPPTTIRHKNDPKEPKKNRKSSLQRLGSSIRMKMKPGKKTNEGQLNFEEEERLSSSTPKKKGLIGIQRLKYDDDDEASPSVSEKVSMFKEYEKPPHTQPLPYTMKRSLSFDSILDKKKGEDSSSRRLDERERRRRLAGYSFVNRQDIPNEGRVIKGRDYSNTDIIYKETENELAFIRKERRKRMGSLDHLDSPGNKRHNDIDDGTRRRQEMERMQKERQNRLSKYSKSMDVSLDTITKIKQIGRVDIPEVFLHHKQRVNADGGHLLSVGRLTIPRAFSTENILDDKEDADSSTNQTEGAYIKVTPELNV